MKILIVGPDKLDSEYGGGQVYVRNLIAGLLNNKHNVEYLSLVFSNINVPQFNQQTTNGILTRQILFPGTWEKKDINNYDSVINYVSNALKDISPDIVHAHGWKEISCLASYNAHVPCIVTVHHGGIVCPAGALLNQHDEICTVPADQQTCMPCCVQNIRGKKRWLPLLRLIPLNFQLHLGQWLSARRFMYFITPLGTMALSIREKLANIQTIGRYATKLIAPTPSVHDALVRNGIPSDKVAIVPHVIPPMKRQSLRHDFGKGPIRFLYLGRISRVKGLHIMLAAFSRLSKSLYEINIVGDAYTRPDKRYRLAMQRQYKAVNAIWHGLKPHGEVVKHIASCDVVVHSTICLEVYGLTIAESLAVGRPVIATRCGGAETQICDGENGFLIPPNDSIALYNALIKVMEHPELIKKMAEHTSRTHTLESHIRDLEEIYNKSRSE